ncbi:MAG: isochorismatase hydrolase family protein [Candidatus Saccharibacteria bacterium]|nr:isochorismatase hydrolase family protein [Candidatus Saccharibacteria bacterium]
MLPKEFNPFVTGKNVFTRATYSGFNSTTLNDYLKSKNTQKVVLCGVDTDACVLATAFDAFDYGYFVDVNFGLTYSGGDLEKEAQAIIKRSLIARE